MSSVITFILIAAGAYWIGRNERELRERLDKVEKPPKKRGATFGSYKKVDEVNPPAPEKKARAHVVTPKTPQRMDWEAQEALREANEKFRVGPR